MLLPRIHSRKARLDLTAKWEVIRDGLTALGEVYSAEFGEEASKVIWGPLDDPIARRTVANLIMPRVGDVLTSLAQDKLTDVRSNND